jgi:hypothetical protein
MASVVNHLGGFITLGLWAAIWVTGGWLLTRRAFRLRPAETAIVGIGVGLAAEDWLTNLAAHFIPAQAAFWAGPALTLIAGVALALPIRRKPVIRFDILAPVGILAVFLITAIIFFAIGRGLAIFDDFQNLPTTSLMAAGDVPPHFPLDPSVDFGYHYFLLLAAAQISRLGGLFAWTALDLARGIAFGLAFVLAGLWGYRLTGNRLAGVLSGVAFGLLAGTRWLLLFAPGPLAAQLDAHVHLIGSGAGTAPKLFAAMTRNWAVEGAGPIPFPFAFANGINTPAVMAHAGRGTMDLVLSLILLLTYHRWRDWRGAAISLILLSSLALVEEVWFILLLAGLSLVLIASWVRDRGVRLSQGRGAWLLIAGLSLVIALVQGGVLSELARGFIGKLGGQAVQAGYYSIGFLVAWPPGVVSSHLGVLSFGDPYQILAALAEIGPVFLVFPLVLIWGVKLLRGGRWLEAAVVGGGLLSLAAVFLRYQGSGGISATTRLFNPFLNVCKIYALPLAWIWLQRRGQWERVMAAGLGMAGALGGVVFLAIELVAIQQPVYSSFIGPLDAAMAQKYWNHLPPGALIFDPMPNRAPTVFGRPTDSSPDWFSTKPEWEALVAHPSLGKLRNFGFDYLYIDKNYWERLSPEVQRDLTAPCAEILGEVSDRQGDFRRLVDIQACPAGG